MNMYETIIIGGGPAGTAAAVYIARKQLKAKLITSEFGGQSVVSNDIGNWIGDINISGVDLAKRFENHIKSFDNIEITEGQKVTSVEKIDGGFKLTTDKDEVFESQTLIITSGGRRRKLNVPGEDEYNGRGVAYCSTCDAPLFKGKEVAVVGGGNAGLEAAVDLLPFATKVYLLSNKDTLKGDPVTQEEVIRNDKVEIIYNALTTEIHGETMVTGLTYTDAVSGEAKKLDVGGIFIEIGSIPNSELLEGLVDVNEYKEIIIDHKTGTTSHEAIFAAGDVTDVKFKQNNISAGDGVKAALSCYAHVLKLRGESNK